MRRHLISIVAGVALGVAGTLALAPSGDWPPEISTDEGHECVVITVYERVLLHPVPGEDDGALYCPTGEWLSSYPS
jgi:hypothetical protein